MSENTQRILHLVFPKIEDSNAEEIKTKASTVIGDLTCGAQNSK